MSDEVYTLGAWRVKEGMEREFVEAWKELGRFFRQLSAPPGEGTLLQGIDDPHEFYSFGPWPSLGAVQDMRHHPDTPEEISKLLSFCEDGHPGTYRVVATG
ncbi:MAG: hypothetical protein WD377_07625 [Nitriliruptoraceae bacterium]